jgi:hypothetical protein
MNITKELIENMVREALDEAVAAEPEADLEAAQGPANDDVSRILTKQDMERINTKPEYTKALQMIVKHAAVIPQGKTILIKLYRELPTIIKNIQ